MKASCRNRIIRLLASLAFLISLTPQTAAAQDGPAFSQQELDQMLAPIALYPDSLLSQILMAATYPREVTDADTWSRANPGLKGDDAVRAVDAYDWDPSVKSLVAFPQILDMMDDKLDWTQRLGDAFLDQQTQVMDTVQNLRQRAFAAGNLRSTEQYRVDQEGSYIAIDETTPQDYSLPYYDPTLVYGSWWWPTYPPVYWAPWPGYYARPGVAFFMWGASVRLGAGFFFGAFDWRQRRVNVVNVNNYYYSRGAPPNRAPGAWQHNPDHRGGVPYRGAAVRQQFGRASVAPDTRRDYRGHAGPVPEQRGVTDDRSNARGGPPPAAAPAPVQESRPQRGSRPEERGAQPAPAASPGMASAPERRSAPGAPVASRPAAEPRPHAFEGVSQGAQVRNYSERGRASAQNAAPPPQAPAAAPAPRPASSAPASHSGGGGPRGGGYDRR